VRHADHNVACVMAHRAFTDWLKEASRTAITCVLSRVANGWECVNHLMRYCRLSHKSWKSDC